MRISRGSDNEGLHWLHRAYCRKLLTFEETMELQTLVQELGPKLNAYLKSIGAPKKEPPEQAQEDPPSTADPESK